MGTHRLTRGAVLIACTALVFASSSCGSDSATDESTDESADTATTDTAATDTATAGTAPIATDTASDDSGALVAFTAAEICERLTPEAVGTALGLDITEAEPADMDTPQCAYSYGMSNVSVASMRPEDVGAMSAAEAFDYVLDINRQVAGDTEVEEVSLDVGDGAVRLSGTAVQLGVLRVGDHVVTLIAPAPDEVDGAGVDALLAQMATAFA